MKNMKQILSDCQGYNLLQMCIALLVIGVLTTPIITIYKIQERQRKIDTTRQNIDSVTNAIQNYKHIYGIYPCPGPMNIPRTDPGYGHEVHFNSAAALNLSCRDTTITAITPGNCGTAGTDRNVCIEQAPTARSVTLTAAGASTRVVVGSVPFRLLQVDEEKTVDGYGSKFVYAVTQSMTDPTTYNERNGAISIRSGTAITTTLTNPDGAASFLVISPGEDQVGGYNLEGNLLKPCTGTGLDLENCNVGFQSGAASNNNAQYIYAYQNSALGANHFDDVINYFVNQQEPLWRRSIADKDVIQDLSDQYVGVGTSTPSTGVELDISSSGTTDSLQVNGTTGTDGKILADRICDYDNPTLCFDPRFLGSAQSVPAPTRLTCPTPTSPGNYMVGINNGQAICAVSPQYRCNDAANPVFYGVDASGQPICGPAPTPPVPPVQCAATTRTLCSTTVNLPATNAGATATVTAGVCARTVYTCRANGTWNSGTTTGQCLATVINVGAPAACNFGYTGTIITTTTTTCTGPGTTTTGNVVANTCVCTGASRTGTRACSADPAFGSGYSGTQTRTETATPPTCAVVNGAWNTSACTCAAGAAGTLRWVANGLCPAGYLPVGPWSLNYGGPEREQRLAANCTWADTGNTRGSCTCNTADRYTYSDHTCDNPTCQQPTADQDIFRQTVNPVGCVMSVPSQTHVGSCTDRVFHWSYISPVGSPVSSYPPDRVDINGVCGCAELGTQTTSCFDPADSSRQPNRCQCQ